MGVKRAVVLVAIAILVVAALSFGCKKPAVEEPMTPPDTGISTPTPTPPPPPSEKPTTGEGAEATTPEAGAGTEATTPEAGAGTEATTEGAESEAAAPKSSTEGYGEPSESGSGGM